MEVTYEQSWALLTYSKGVETADPEARGVGLKVLLREGFNLDRG